MTGVVRFAAVAVVLLAACGPDEVGPQGSIRDILPDDPGFTPAGNQVPPERPPPVLGEFPALQREIATMELEIAPADLAKLDADPASDDQVPAVVNLGGRRAPAKLRYRGASSRWLPQKGFNIELDKGYELDYRDRFQIIAEWPDAGKLAEKFAFDLFTSLGVRASDAKYVNLRVNGKAWGLYLDVEHVGKRFLRMHGFESDATIYRCGGRNCEMKIAPPGPYQQDFTRRTNETLPDDDMKELLRFINRTDDAEFERQLPERIDLDAYLGNLAGELLISSIILEDLRGFWIHELDRDKWSYAPWDLNNSFLIFWRTWAVTDPPKTKRAARAFTVYDPDVETLYNERLKQYPTSQRPTWSVLNTRIWDRPALRNALLDKVEWAMNGPFSEAKAVGHAGSVWQLMSADLFRDPHVDPAYAPHALDKFRTYVQNRRAFIQREMPNLRNHGNGALVINEVAFDAPGRPGYVELYNRGATPISLAGYSLTNDLRLPKLHTLPALVVPAGGHLQIPTSTLPFGLGTAGGELGIFDGTRVYDPFDAVYFGPHAAGTAYGRYPDGSEDFRAMTPTPGTANAAN